MSPHKKSKSNTIDIMGKCKFKSFFQEIDYISTTCILYYLKDMLVLNSQFLP